MIINGNLKFHTLGAGEIQNAVIERVTTTQLGLIFDDGGAIDGRLIFDIDTNTMYYGADGTFVPLASGTGDAAAVSDELEKVEASLGSFLNADGTFNETTLNAFGNVADLTNESTLLDALVLMDAAITAAAAIDTLAEMTDVTLTDLTIGEIIIADSTSTFINQTFAQAGIQPLDSDLTALAGLSSNGILVRTSEGVITTRTLGVSAVAGDEGISIVNGDGLSGAPVIGLDIIGLNAAGTLNTTDSMVMFDGTNNVEATVAQLTAGVILTGIALDDVSDVDDSVSRTADLAVIFMADGTNLDTVTLIGGTSVTAVSVSGMSVTLNVDDDFLKNDGDTLDSGALTIALDASIIIATGGDITAVDLPTNPNDLTNKTYVDALYASGATWKNPVVDSDLVEITATEPAGPITAYALLAGDNVSFIASAIFTTTGGTANITTVIGSVFNLQVAGDGVAFAYSLIESPITAGDRFIIAAEHGKIGAVLTLLDINSDGFTLADGDLIEYTGGTVTAAASWSTPDGRSGLALGGTELAQGVTVLNADPDSVHYGHVFMYDQVSDAWIEIAGPGSIGAGTGLSYTGNTLNIGMGAGIIALPADEVGIDLYDSANGALMLTNNGTARGTATGDRLYLKLDSTTLAQTASGLAVADGGITNLQVSTTAAIVYSKLVTMSGDATITAAGVLTIADGAVDNVMLANDSITLAADTGTTEDLALGDTLTIAGGIGLTSTVSATDTVTVDMDIVNLTAVLEAGIDSAVDSLVLYDVSGSTHLKVTIDELANSMGAVTAIGELSDTNVTAAVDGDVLVQDNGVFVNKQIHFVYDAVSDISEVSTVTTVADVTDSLDGKYFAINTTTTDYFVWINTSVGGASAPVGGVGTPIEVAVTTGSTAINVAIAIAAAINAVVGLTSPVPTTATLTITADTVGDTTNVVDIDTGFAVATTTEGNAAMSLATHVVAHNLGQQFCNVTVVDASNEVIIPQSITLDSATQLTVTFNTAITCRVIVTGVAGV